MAQRPGLARFFQSRAPAICAAAEQVEEHENSGEIAVLSARNNRPLIRPRETALRVLPLASVGRFRWPIPTSTVRRITWALSVDSSKRPERFPFMEPACPTNPNPSLVQLVDGAAICGSAYVD